MASWFAKLQYLGFIFGILASKDGSKEHQQGCICHTPGVISLYSDVMPFGLFSTMATFKLVLSGLNWKIYLIYLDDVIVYGGNFYDALGMLKMVWQVPLPNGH